MSAQFQKPLPEYPTIKESQEVIIEEFGCFEQWMDKYEYLIDLGKKLPMIEEAFKTERHLIRGCQSQVWLRAEMRGGALTFTADSDAMITKGIIALLIRVLDARTPSEVAGADLYFIDAIGLREHLSSTRSNGLRSMVDTLKAMGAKFSKAH